MGRQTTTFAAANEQAEEARPPQRTLPSIIDDIEQRSIAQSQDIAELRARLDAMEAEKAELAARLGEADRDLAEARSALDGERKQRERLEVQIVRLRDCIAAARSALDGGLEPASAPDDGEAAQSPDDPADPGAEDGAAMMLLSPAERQALEALARSMGLSCGALIADLCRQAIGERRCTGAGTRPQQPDP